MIETGIMAGDCGNRRNASSDQLRDETAWSALYSTLAAPIVREVDHVHCIRTIAPSSMPSSATYRTF
jgi:hypothetical protein